MSEPVPPSANPARDAGGRGALFVAAGIFASRLMGLVRERAFAHYLGNSIPAAAFRAALRVPNFLQNLFGEGVLSASFIPVYAQLLGRGDKEEADQVASAVFGLLSLATGVLVALGVFGTPLLVDLIVPGFEGESRELAIRLVRVLFPGTGLLVMSAWCLGILNSHRRFFLSYAAPVVWNAAQIATLVAFGGWRLPRTFAEQASLAEALAWAALVGSFLQFAVQWPAVLRLLARLRPSLDVARASVRQVLRPFGPVVVGRGVVQLSAYVDTAVASLISARCVSAMAFAQQLYLLPVSLFGMAVSAAELPEMARATTGEAAEVHAKLRERLNRGTQRIAFFVVPSVAAFLFIGDVVSGALLQTGLFTARDTRFVWYLLVGASVGLLASTLGRLYASAYYALKDTRTPLLFATVRVALTAGAAYVFGLHGPTWLGWPGELGGALILGATGVAGWVEFLLLKRKLASRIGHTGFAPGVLPRLWGAASAAGLAGVGIKMALTAWRGPAPAALLEWNGALLSAPNMHPVLVALAVILPFGGLYFALAAALGIPEARRLIGRVLRRR